MTGANEFKALYDASLLAQSQAAFYRLPLQNSFRGYISNTLTGLTNDCEGFIIRPFETTQDPQLIQNEISFVFEDTLSLKVSVQNEFTDTFKQYYVQCLNEGENGKLSSLYTARDIHASTRDEFIENVETAKKEISKGVFKKVVLSRVSKFNYTKSNHVTDIFLSLCAKYPAAFVSLISSPSFGTWLGASPEILLQQEDENYSTVALAGTKETNRGAVFTGKEREEQGIIREYIESTLRKQDIETKSSALTNLDTGSLTHLKTSITFKAPREQRFNILQQLHPTPAVGGYPNENAVHFILEKENYPRDIYAGYIGPVGKEEMNMFVNIRCMQWQPGYALVYAGAGITAASNAEAEWNETENKMKVIASIL